MKYEKKKGNANILSKEPTHINARYKKLLTEFLRQLLLNNRDFRAFQTIFPLCKNMSK